MPKVNNYITTNFLTLSAWNTEFCTIFKNQLWKHKINVMKFLMKNKNFIHNVTLFFKKRQSFCTSK